MSERCVPRFSISILAMDGLAMTRRCIEAVIRTTAGFHIELLLTDNASKDGTAEYFDSLCVDDLARVTHNPVNLGFNVPNNLALEKARGEFFITLNNDVVVPDGWLGMLLNEFERHPDAGLAGASGTCCGFLEGDSFHGVGGVGLEYIEASCMMGRTDVLRNYGLFSKYLSFAYAEDADLSLRMRALGFSLHQAPFHVEHTRAASSSQVPDLARHQQANHDALQRRWGGYLRTRNIHHSILVRRKGALGDVLLTTPIIRDLRRQHPKSRIYVETDFGDVFEGNPHITGCQPFYAPKDSVHVIDLNGAYESSPDRHIVESYAWKAAIDLRSNAPELWGKLPEGDYTTKRWVALHCGPHHWPGKDWSLENWQMLSKWLADLQWHVVLVGVDRTGDIPCELDMRGRTSLASLAALFKTVKLFVGIDSGPLHVAQAIGTPVIGLFGCTSSRFILTEGSRAVGLDADPSVPCAGIRHRTKSVNFVHCSRDCIQSISVERVTAAVNEMFPARKKYYQRKKAAA